MEENNEKREPVLIYFGNIGVGKTFKNSNTMFGVLKFLEDEFYLLVDDEIKKGNWFYVEGHNNIKLCDDIYLDGIYQNDDCIVSGRLPYVKSKCSKVIASSIDSNFCKSLFRLNYNQCCLIKNIPNIYDLSHEYYIEECPIVDNSYILSKAFEDGFKKNQELSSDKKFTRQDMIRFACGIIDKLNLDDNKHYIQVLEENVDEYEIKNSECKVIIELDLNIIKSDIDGSELIIREPLIKDGHLVIKKA